MSDDELTAPCLHQVFEAKVEVNRISDPSQPLKFHADVRVWCVECGAKFRFKGLRAGYNINGAAVSLDGTEARLAIEPIE